MADTNKLQIVVDDGSQRVPILNRAGDEIGVFYFRPTDLAIIRRYNEAISKVDEVVAPLEGIDIGADGTAAKGDSAAIDALNEAEKKLFEICDFIFDGNMSEAFFGKMHPFSPVNGVFYCEIALEKVGAFIAAQFEEETKQISKRLNKYVGQYSKGKKK